MVIMERLPTTSHKTIYLKGKRRRRIAAFFRQGAGGSNPFVGNMAAKMAAEPACRQTPGNNIVQIVCNRHKKSGNQ